MSTIHISIKDIVLELDDGIDWCIDMSDKEKIVIKITNLLKDRYEERMEWGE